MVSLRHCWRHIAAITFVAALALGGVSAVAPPEPQSGREWLISAAASAISLIVFGVALVAVIHVAARGMQMPRRRLTLRLVWAALVLTILSAIASLIGLLALVIGAVIVFAYTLTAPSVLIVENVSSWTALRRSIQLTRRAPWRTLWIAVALLVVSLLPSLLLLVEISRTTMAASGGATALLIPIYALVSLHLYTVLNDLEERKPAQGARRWLPLVGLALLVVLLCAGALLSAFVVDRHRQFEAYEDEMRPLISTVYSLDLTVHEASQIGSPNSAQRAELTRMVEAIARTWNDMEDVRPGGSLEDAHDMWLRAAAALHGRAELLADGGAPSARDDEPAVTVTEVADPAVPIADAALETLSAEAMSLAQARALRRDWAEYYLEAVDQDRLLLDDGVDCSTELQREYARLDYECDWLNQLDRLS